MDKFKKFRKELAVLINKYGLENGSDTPDFMLAKYLTECLAVFDRVTISRSKWYRKR